ncbi:hypothetical protein [Oricola indica]|uniref:hypothetical protein n=1 Tax=Oricola indica TaxID=2872591 RepID=UPI001CBEE487|nr:hypothetical protein [Oricola indica]
MAKSAVKTAGKATGSLQVTATSRTLVARGALARVLNCNTRTVGRFEEKGIIAPEHRSGTRYILELAVPAVVEHLRQVAANRKVETEDGDTVDPTREAALLNRQKRQLAIEQTRAAQIKNAALDGSLIRRDRVTTALAQVIASAKSKITALPSLVATQIPGLTRDDMITLDDIARGILDDLSADMPEAAKRVVMQEHTE